MTFVEYGQQNKDLVMLLHGGGLSWWNYREVAQKLAGQYHVVMPVLDGHADSDAPFRLFITNSYLTIILLSILNRLLFIFFN